MKRKSEFVILFVIITVSISYLLLHKKDRTHYQLPLIPEIAKNRITQIDINTATDRITLNKKDNTWHIGPEAYPADPDKVNRMLDVIEKLTITALVSESKNYTRYDLNDASKIRVKAWEGDKVSRQFDIGKSATTFRHTFVKLDQNPFVYHARGDFRHKFDLTLGQLRDKSVLSFKPAHITAVNISKKEKVYTIKRNEQPLAEAGKTENGVKPSAAKEPKTIWQTDDGRQLDAAVLKRLLATLSRLDCETFIDGGTKDEFTDPILVVELTGKAETYTLSIFSKRNQQATTYPATSSKSQYPFFLSASDVDALNKMLEEIMAESSGSS